MAKNTVIVELAGLPACGKTTLANGLKIRMDQRNRNAAVWTDLTKEFKTASPFQILGSFSAWNTLRYIRLISVLPKEVGNRKYMLWYAIKISLIYRYSRKYSSYDYVFMDHGFIQQAVSMQSGADLSRNHKFQDSFAKLLKSETKYDYLFDCRISIDAAQHRMIQRKRFAEGRLDAVVNPTEQRNLFQKEKRNFDAIIELVEMQELPGKKVIIDMDQPEDSLVKIAMTYLGDDQA